MSAHGILLIDKPAGLTSNAVLGRAKYLLGIRKAGHTGTLDPFATGLLVLCFGEATKISGHLLDADKCYRATVRLGETTATGDPEGEVIARGEIPEIDEAALASVFQAFVGRIEQIPPMHSALKHQGKRLYELAREGKHVERKPREVTIHNIQLAELTPPCFTMDVTCSKGTYIRTLAADMGERLGCGAHLSALRRTASGPFDLRHAVTLEALESLTLEQRRALFRPIGSAFPHWPVVELDEQQGCRFSQGQKLPRMDTSDGPVLVNQEGRLIGIGEVDGARVLKPKRLFAIS